MAVAIRRTGNVQVSPSPVTMTPPSKWEGFLGFANQLVGLGDTLRRLGDRRNDEKVQSEKAKVNSYFLNFSDTIEGIRLNFTGQPSAYTGFTAAIKAPVQDALDYMEKEITTDRGKGEFYSKINAVINKHQDPLLKEQSAEIAQKREADFSRVVAINVPNTNDLGQNLFNPDPNVRRAARNDFRNMNDIFLSPDAIPSHANPLGSAAVHTRYKRQIAHAAGMAYLSSQSTSNIVQAREQFLAQGAPDPDHPDIIYGRDQDAAWRRGVVADFDRNQRILDDMRKKEEDKTEEELEDRTALYLYQKYLNAAAGVPEDAADVLANVPDPTDPRVIQLAKDIAKGPWESVGQQMVWGGVERQVLDEIRRIGISNLNSVSDLDALRQDVAQRTDIHYSRRAELISHIGEKMDEAEGFTGLTPEQQDEVRVMNGFDRRFHLGPEAALIYKASELAAVMSLRSWLSARVADPTFNNQAALDIANAAHSLPGDIVGGMVSAFDTPESLIAMRKDPISTMKAFPTVIEDVFVFDINNQIDTESSILALDALGLGAADPQYQHTYYVLRFMRETLSINPFIDPAEMLKQVQAAALSATGVP